MIAVVIVHSARVAVATGTFTSSITTRVGGGSRLSVSDIEGAVVVVVVVVVVCMTGGVVSIVESIKVAVVISVVVAVVIAMSIVVTVVIRMVIPTVVIRIIGMMATPAPTVVETVVIVAIIVVVRTIVVGRPPPAVTEVNAHAPACRIVAVPVVVGEVRIIVAPAVVAAGVEAADTG